MNEGKYDFDKCVAYFYPHLKKLLGICIPLNEGIRFKIIIDCKLIKVEIHEIVDRSKASFCSDFVTSFSNHHLGSTIWDCINDIIEKLIRHCLNGSGWIFQKVIAVRVKLIKHTPFIKDVGGSYLPLPACLVRKNGLINIRNEQDELCFLWCCALHLHIQKTNEIKGKHLRKISTFYQYIRYFNFNGISFPVGLYDIPLFEKNNTISINIFRFTEDRSIVPAYAGGKIYTCKHATHYTRYQKSLCLYKRFVEFIR